MNYREIKVVAPYERPALSKAYLFPEGAAQVPGFHVCVGIGGERQLPEWYSEKGAAQVPGFHVCVGIGGEKQLPEWYSEKAFHVCVGIGGERQLPEWCSEKVPHLFTADIAYKGKGMEIIKGTVATGFGTDEHVNVKIVKLKDGRELEADVVGVGGRPLTGLFKGQFQEEKGGIKATKAKEGGKSIDEYDYPLYFYSRSFDLSWKIYGGK